MPSQSSAPVAVPAAARTPSTYDPRRAGATAPHRADRVSRDRLGRGLSALLVAALSLTASSCAVAVPESRWTALAVGGALGLLGGLVIGWREGQATTREQYRAPIARARMHVRTLLRWAGENPELALANVAAWERLAQTEGALLDVSYPEPRPVSWELRDLPTPRARVRT